MPTYSDHDPQVERRRLFVQSEAFEALSERVFEKLGSLEGAHVVDLACGARCMLPVLSRRVGPRGRVVGTDISDTMLSTAKEFCAEQKLTNVEIIRDDAYNSALPAHAFDVVH